MPQSEKSVKVVLNSYHLTVSAEQIKKITEVFQDYVAKK
jgi:DNA-directed RNA polymerase subunit F